MTTLKIKNMINISSVKEVLLTVVKVISLLTCLYFFVCSLSFLSDSFRILGGKNIGSLFSNSDLLKELFINIVHKHCLQSLFLNIF